MRIRLFRVKDGVYMAMVEAGRSAHIPPLFVQSTNKVAFNQAIDEAIDAVDKAERLPFPDAPA